MQCIGALVEVGVYHLELFAFVPGPNVILDRQLGTGSAYRPSDEMCTGVLDRSYYNNFRQASITSSGEIFSIAPVLT